MKKQAILLVHGMGVHSAPTKTKPGAFGKEFIDATTETLQQFSKHTDDTLADYVDIHEFNYDGWFDKMRTAMADTAKDMSKRIQAVGAVYGMSFPLELAGRLAGWEAKFGNDSFFYTHCLDVIFYGTLLGGKVRVDAALKVAELVQDYGVGNVHVIAHSLGTAVVHDTLHLLYRPESDPNNEVPDLSVVNHQLGSLWMFANVSGLVTTVTRFTDPLSSVVKPGDDGCTAKFFNVRHKLDPITWLARFDPQNNGIWVPGNIFVTRYVPVVTELMVEADTHSFSQYVKDPRVVTQLFPALLGKNFKTTPEEFQAFADNYAKGSINGAYAALEDSIRNLSGDVSSWEDFLKTAKAFFEAVQHLKDNF